MNLIFHRLFTFLSFRCLELKHALSEESKNYANTGKNQQVDKAWAFMFWLNQKCLLGIKNSQIAASSSCVWPSYLPFTWIHWFLNLPGLNCCAWNTWLYLCCLSLISHAGHDCMSTLRVKFWFSSVQLNWVTWKVSLCV